MNITPFEMYLITMLDNFHNVGIAIALIFVVLAVFAIWLMFEGSVKPSFTVITIVGAFIGILIASFVPTTKQMAAILIIPKIANSEKVEMIGNGLYDLAVEWMNELKPSKKEGK